MSNKSNGQQGTDSGNGHATLWQSIGTQLPQVRHAANRCHHRILSCELGSHLSQNCSETMIENSLQTPWIIPKNMCLGVYLDSSLFTKHLASSEPAPLQAPVTNWAFFEVILPAVFSVQQRRIVVQRFAHSLGLPCGEWKMIPNIAIPWNDS